MRFNWKRLGWGVLIIIMAWAVIITAPVTSKTPEIKIGRATWDTGWFQTEVYRELLNRLGYSVATPQTYENADFYQALAKGEVDFWVNGWFPLHSQYLEASEVRQNVEKVGYQVAQGATQGYLVDQKTAQKYQITHLSDLKDPKIAKLFDRDNNGKADLMGCNRGWDCAAIIDHHLQAYGLTDTVEQVQGDYSPMMMNTWERYQQGDPILFYTWTPNWTIGELVPGEDVQWLEVPFATLPQDKPVSEEDIAIDNVSGCLSNPCQLGFPVNDIRVVANRRFLEDYPGIRRLLELVEIPLEDIAAQNSQMIAGQDQQADLRQAAKDWLNQNSSQVEAWLKQVKAVTSLPTSLPEESPSQDERFAGETLTVVTKILPPFVMYENQSYAGFSIDLWSAIAQEIGINYEIIGVNSIAKALDDVSRKSADIAIGGLSITSKREESLDFSHAIFESGLQILIQDQDRPFYITLWHNLIAIFTSKQLYYGVGVFTLTLFLAGTIMWLIERRSNQEFPPHYRRGILEGIWWAAVTVTTVGYGDKTPKKPLGRLVGLIWMCSGYFIFAYFTATVTTSFTLQGLENQIRGVDDLSGKPVATIEKSFGAEYLAGKNIKLKGYQNQDKMYDDLRNNVVEAVIYDAPVLKHYVHQEENQDLKLVGLTFQEFDYGIAMPINSSHRNAINVALLKLKETGRYEEIYQKWF